MSPDEFNNLLYRGESETLEFKADNYSLDDDDEKGEFLKDLLAFVNAWRESDAYILLGVQGDSGGKAQVAGITKERDDNALQNLASGKIKPPIRFSYETLDHDGKRVGVIHVPKQARPAYLLKDFGKLRAHTVYIRRGSSTGIALPDEVARMGSYSTMAVAGPKFIVRTKIRFTSLTDANPRLFVKVWLENSGNATAHDLMVETISQSHRNNGFSSYSWNITGTTALERYLYKFPVHRTDRIQLSIWFMKDVELEVDSALKRTGRIAKHSGETFDLCLRMLARDQPPSLIRVNLSGDEIKALKEKCFEPDQL